MKKLARMALGWLAESMLKLLLAKVTLYAGPALLLVLPSLVLWWTRSISYLRSGEPLPVWALSIAAGVSLVLLLFIGRQRVEIIRLSRRATDTFLHQGLEFKLTQDFWSNYERTLASWWAPAALMKVVVGPFCPTCGVDVAYSAWSEGCCTRCGTVFPEIGDDIKKPNFNESKFSEIL